MRAIDAHTCADHMCFPQVPVNQVSAPISGAASLLTSALWGLVGRNHGNPVL